MMPVQVVRARGVEGSAAVKARALFHAVALAACLVTLALATTTARAAVFNPKTFTLANGLRVVVIEKHGLPVVRQIVFYRVGSADDPPGKSGLAHYLEHLMFKGTPSVPAGEFSKIVARNGGRDNAFTSYDTTGYYQTVAKDRLELVMRLEADRMANLSIAPEQAVPELQVVIEERRARTDNRPADQFEEQIAAAFYLNEPYRVPIIGWQHELEKLTVDDAIEFYRHHYGPNNAILVIAGDVTVDEVRPLAEKYYGVVPRNPAIRPRIRTREPPHRAAVRVTMTSKRVHEARWSRDYLAPSRVIGEKRHSHALEVLSDILGGGATSRLYRALVRDQKLALSVDAWYDADMIGHTSFGLGGRPRANVSVGTLEAAIDKQIKHLLADGVTAEEVATAKKRLLASAIFARDSLRRGAISIGVALTTGQTIDSVESWPDRIKAVTVADVNAAARHVLRIERSVTGELLPEAAASDASDRAGVPAERTARRPKGEAK